jgi:CBS domain-containing protein
MKVQDAMNENVKFCQPDTNLAEATAMMWEYDCGALPVVVDGGKAIGVITDRDLAIAAGTKNRPASEIQVGEVMSRNLFAASAEDDLHTALTLMRKEKVRRLPVTNPEGVLKGILCLNDVALLAEHPDVKTASQVTYEDVVRTLKALCEHRHHEVAMEHYKSVNA